MRGLQPAGATRVALDVIIPSPTGLTPEKWKQTGENYGPVNGPTGRLEPQRDSEELQRALEGELVGFLRQQNSKLMDESAYLRSKLDGGSNGKATSGMETSPWSEIDGSADSSRVFVGSLQPERPG